MTIPPALLDFMAWLRCAPPNTTLAADHLYFELTRLLDDSEPQSAPLSPSPTRTENTPS